MLRTATLTTSSPQLLPSIRAEQTTRWATPFDQWTKGWPSAWAGVVGTWFQRHRQRRALVALDDRLLRDIGVTHAQAQHEAGKPFWFAGKA